MERPALFIILMVAAKSFIGSVNESKSAFAHNYELIWQDDDSESADWVEEEFWALWEDGVPLPDAILAEISRVASAARSYC